MTTAAICASREVSDSPSFYRGEQFDADLSLYYLRARYYNPQTGRFLSRDPEDGNAKDPQSLHKYLYAGGDPVNWADPIGRDFVEVSEEDEDSEKEAEEGLPPVAERIECILNTASDVLDLADAASTGDIVGSVSSSFSIVADLSACKAALKKVHGEVGGPLPRQGPGLHGAPQAGTPRKGYRMDQGHPSHPTGDPGAGPHFNWWDYTGGKRGSGGREGTVPIG
jgi:RHS repeat-associated protein